MRALQSGPAHPSTSKKNKKTKEKHEDSSRKTGLRKWACSVHYVTNEFRSGWREGGGWGEEESNHRPSLATDGPIRGDDDLLLFFFSFPSGSSSRRLELVGSVGFSFLFFFSVHVGVVFIGRQLAVTSASCFYVFFFKKKLSRVCFFGKDSTGRWRVFLGFPATAFATVQKNEKKRTSTHKKTDQMI